MPIDQPAGVSDPPWTSPGKSSIAGQQATDAPHVTIAVAFDLVVDPLERQQLFLKRGEWLENPLQLKVFAFGSRARSVSGSRRWG